VPRPAGPIAVSRTLITRTDQAYVLGGFFGADLANVRDGRLLALAARVLSTRMNRTIREERQLVYSIGAGSRPGEAYPGFGVFSAQAPTDPTKAHALAAAIDEMVSALVAEGPSDEEVTVARQQLVNQIDEALKGPDYWSDRLATLDYRGLRLDDVARILDDLKAYTAAEVRDAVARYAKPDARFSFVILPEAPR
jgi:zinc protease